MDRILVSTGPVPGLRDLLSTHPHVDVAGQAEGAALAWAQGEWSRIIFTASSTCELMGLVELMDNNPLVCADEFSVPSPASTLALIALGPLARAGLILDRPTLMLNIPAEEEDVRLYLSTMGWADGCTLSAEAGLGLGVAAATAMAAIRNPDSFDELDALYEEAYGRSFFVRRDEASEWDPSLVAGKPYALYRLRLTPGDSESLLTIQVMADLNGKCGAAQILHAFNVMAGFEESLGIA